MCNNIITVLKNYGIMQKSNKCKLPNIFFICVWIEKYFKCITVLWRVTSLSHPPTYKTYAVIKVKNYHISATLHLI